MNTKSTILLLISIIIFGYNANSQKKWTLEECITYALQHNIDIKQTKLQMDIQDLNLLRSKAAMLPTINANANDIANWGKTVDRFTNQFADARTVSINLYMQSSVTVFNGFKLLNSVKKNKLELAAQKYDFDYQKDLKSMEITTAFLQILYDQENLKNKSEQVKLTIMQVDRTQKLYDAGSIAKGDLYNIKSQLAIEQATYIDAENNLNLSMLKLKQLMYLPGDTTIEIYAPDIQLTEDFNKLENPYQVYDYAIKNRPEIKSAQIRIESSMKDLSIAKGGISPTLTLSAGLGSGYSGATSILDGNPVFTGFAPSGDITTGGDTVISPTFQYNTKTKNWQDQFFDNKNYSIGLYLSIPIFNGLQNYTNISQSKIAMQQAELQLEKSKNDIKQTIEQAYADARSAYKQYQAAKIKVDAIIESYDYASQRFDAKTITAFEYNDAKIKLDIAKSDMINAKYNYVFRVKVLDFYNGKPLKL